MALTPNETISLLQHVSAYDSRKPSKSTASAFERASIEGNWTSLFDAIRAVDKHFAECTDWLMPGHVTAWFRAQRRQPVKIAELRKLSGPPPASADVRAAVVKAASEKYGRHRDANFVQNLGPLEELSVDLVMRKYGWPRNKASAALHAARCIEDGIEPPKPRERMAPLRGRARSGGDDAAAAFAGDLDGLKARATGIANRRSAA